MTTLTHAEMHQQSRFWQNEEALWHDDIRAWEEELTQTLAEAERLQTALLNHQKGLRNHAAAIRLHGQDEATHAHALAEYERGNLGADLLGLAREHQEKINLHIRQRHAHERVKRRHHTVMAHWRLLLKALSDEA
jgi:hypothetical protein